MKFKLHRYEYGIVLNMGTGTGIYHFFLNICGPQWILDIRYDTGMSIECDTGMGTWAKMEYLCNLG